MTPEERVKETTRGGVDVGGRGNTTVAQQGGVHQWGFRDVQGVLTEVWVLASSLAYAPFLPVMRLRLVVPRCPRPTQTILDKSLTPLVAHLWDSP